MTEQPAQFTPPLTEAKAALLDRTRSEAEAMLDDIVRRWPVDIVTMEEANDVFADGVMPKGRALKHIIDRVGLVKVGRVETKGIFGTPSKTTAYSVRNHQQWKSAGIVAWRQEIDRISRETKLSALFEDEGHN